MRRTAEERQQFVAQRASEMLRQPTPAERALRELLKPLGFRFQVPLQATTKNGGVFDYIADCLLEEARLIVEVDGSAHRRSRGRDRRRDTRLRTDGYRTLRFTNQQVLNKKKVAEVMLAIKAAIGDASDGNAE